MYVFYPYDEQRFALIINPDHHPSSLGRYQLPGRLHLICQTVLSLELKWNHLRYARDIDRFETYTVFAQGFERMQIRPHDHCHHPIWMATEFDESDPDSDGDGPV